MRTALLSIALLVPFISHAKFENAIVQDITRRYVSVRELQMQPQVRLLPGSYGIAQLSDTIQANTVTKAGLREIWLIYTDFAQQESFDQGRLNRERVRHLDRLLPGISRNTNIRWTLMRITGIQNIDTARIQYHGFVFFYATTTVPSLGNVLDRHRSWDSLIVVMDVTTSMLPWLQEATSWLHTHYSDKRIDRFVYFNDGDGKPDHEKVTGKTGGIHSERGEDYHTYVKGIKKHMITGMGNGDFPENTIEALIEAQRYAEPGSVIVLLADNYSTPRDTALIDSLYLPVKVIACGTRGVDIHPALVNIAYRTGGSLHTCSIDVRDFGGVPRRPARQQLVLIGEHTYITVGKQMRCKTCKNDPSLMQENQMTRR